MRIKSLARLGLCASVAHAFQDTSPFFYYSSLAPSSPDPNFGQLAQSSRVESKILDMQKACSQAYIIISQPGASAWDFQQHGAAPHLTRRMSGQKSEVQSTYEIPEVLGELDGKALAGRLERQCDIKRSIDMPGDQGELPDSLWGTAEPESSVVHLTFSSLPDSLEERQKRLAANDYLIEEAVSSAPKPYTVIYVTTPPSAEVLARQQRASSAHSNQAAENHLGEPAHIDLKRNSYNRRDSNGSDNDRGLFEKYNFLSPGLFMTIFASLIILSVIYTGIYALGSLEITYMAFSKEMGPKAQNKQQ